MSQLPPPNVARWPLSSAPTAQPIVLDNAVREHNGTRFKALPGRFETKFIKSAERGQVNAGESRIRGSFRHVEFSQMRRADAFILERH